MCPLCSVFFGIQHVESRLCFILHYIQEKFVRSGSNFSLQKWIETGVTFLVHCLILLHHQKKGTNIASTPISASGRCLEGVCAAATTCVTTCASTSSITATTCPGRALWPTSPNTCCHHTFILWCTEIFP